MLLPVYVLQLRFAEIQNMAAFNFDAKANGFINLIGRKKKKQTNKTKQKDFLFFVSNFWIS